MAAQLSAQGPTAFAHGTTETVTSAAHVLGTRGFDTAGNEYRYIQFTDAVGAGGWVVLDGAWAGTRVATASVGPLAVAQTSVAASAYGWAKVYGVESVAQISTGDSAATSTYILTAPSGVTSEPTLTAAARSSAAATNPVFGAKITAAASTATTGTSSSHSGTTVAVFLNYPFLSGLNADQTS